MVLDFFEIKKEDVAVAGGKGANLGEMTAANINVPKGFIITADIYIEFLKYNKIDVAISEKLREAKDEEEKLLKAAGSFREMIKCGQFSDKTQALIADKYLSIGDNARVAVRSSATAEDLPDASFAGQQETYLNVRGISDVLEKVRNCYASLWGERAVSYRFNQGYAQDSVSIAVVIQEMVESEKAGVLFTVNPINKNENEMQINASYGLGESVVSGRVTADSYTVDRNGKILNLIVGSKESQIVYASSGTTEVPVAEAERKKRALSDSEVSALVYEGLKIEKLYHMPMDIEWAIKGGKVYILQARAITTLKSSINHISEDNLVQKYTKGKKINRSTRAYLQRI